MKEGLEEEEARRGQIEADRYRTLMIDEDRPN